MIANSALTAVFFQCHLQSVTFSESEVYLRLHSQWSSLRKMPKFHLIYWYGNSHTRELGKISVFYTVAYFRKIKPFPILAIHHRSLKAS